MLILRGVTHPVLAYDPEPPQDEPIMLELSGRMLLIAVFPETDGQPARIES